MPTIDDEIEKEEKKEKKGFFSSLGSSLECIIGKTASSMLSDAAYFTYYSVKAGLGATAALYLAGPAALILPAGMALGTVLGNKKKKKKTAFKDIANDIAIGSLLGAGLNYTFAGGQYIGKMVAQKHGALAGIGTKALYGASVMVPFVAAHEYLNRMLIREHKKKSMGRVMKELKEISPYIAPLVMANYSITPPFLKMPMAAAIAVLYGALKSAPEKEEGKKPAPNYSSIPPELRRQLAAQGGL